MGPLEAVHTQVAGLAISTANALLAHFGIIVDTTTTFPSIWTLSPSIAYFVILSFVRLVLQRFVFKKLALKAMGLKYPKFVADRAKDAVITQSKKEEESVVLDRLVAAFASQGFSRTEASAYLRSRQQTTHIRRREVKFIEALWRCMLYLLFTIVGSYALFYPQPAAWIADTRHHWIAWPDHVLSTTLQFYYHAQIGSYLHQLLWTEVSRSDALEMIVHHFVTLALLFLSYLSNFTRIGTTILLLHDTADVFLESAKVFNYTSKAKGHYWAKHCCDVLFGTFAVTFFITRLVLYPRYMLYSVLVETIDHFGAERARELGLYHFSGLLIVLQVLHVFWFYTIARMIYKLVTTGIEKDERSDDEGDVDVVEGEIGQHKPPSASASGVHVPITRRKTASKKE